MMKSVRLKSDVLTFYIEINLKPCPRLLDHYICTITADGFDTFPDGDLVEQIRQYLGVTNTVGGDFDRPTFQFRRQSPSEPCAIGGDTQTRAS